MLLFDTRGADPQRRAGCLSAAAHRIHGSSAARFRIAVGLWALASQVSALGA